MSYRIFVKKAIGAVATVAGKKRLPKTPSGSWEEKKIRRLPVINGQKRMVGMLILGDVSHAASREMLGEVMAAVSAHHT